MYMRVGIRTSRGPDGLRIKNAVPQEPPAAPPPPPVGNLTFTNLGASAAPDINSSLDATSYANASWTPPTAGLILLFVRNRAAVPGTPTVSGNGITWTSLGEILNGVSRLTAFGANAAGSSAGATTIDMGGATQLACQGSFFLAEGVDLSGGVLAAVVQLVTGTAVNQMTLAINLAAAGSANNRPVAAFNHASTAEGSTERANWTEMDDLVVAAGGSSLQTQVRGDAFETTASATWASAVNCEGIALELKAA